METLDESHTGPAELPSVPPPEAGAKALRIAYLLSQYPAVSHTFLLHEVLGLRARGLHIETASINPPDRPIDQLPPLEAMEVRTTRYIKHGEPLYLLRVLLGTAFRHPRVVLRGLSAILRIPMPLRQRAFHLFYLAEAMIVGRWMRQRQLTHIHVHFGGAVASVGMLVSAAWLIPYSLTIHGPEELLHPELCQLREKVARASFVLCISDFCRDELYKLSDPLTWSKFRVIRLGVDPVVLNPSLRLPDSARSSTLELLCVGRLVAAKGHLILLRALASLQSRGIPLHATLVGAGPERDVLERFAEQNLPPGAITFTSALSHPQTLELLRNADIFALASFAEGIPVAIMEAMSLGLPCVSTSIAGIPELIRSGQDGLLVPAGDVKALTNALAALALDPDLRKRLGRSGRQRILTDYNLPLNHEDLALNLIELVQAASLAHGADQKNAVSGQSTQGAPR